MFVNFDKTTFMVLGTRQRLNSSHQMKLNLDDSRKNFLKYILLRAEPLYVLTAMRESQHMTDQLLLGVFNLVVLERDSEKILHLMIQA